MFAKIILLFFFCIDSITIFDNKNISSRMIIDALSCMLANIKKYPMKLIYKGILDKRGTLCQSSLTYFMLIMDG